MESFSILNSRKRAVIALVHTVVFLTVAGIQAAVSHAEPLAIHGSRATSGLILLGIYVVVTTVLLVLLKASDCSKEKLYFALCAGSASFGLVRIVMGDQVLHVNVMRVLLLGCAVLVGMVILRTHSLRTQLQLETSAD
ncbi:MAG: hypothetical protein WAM71_16135 [Candidatus Korobacteraceae bacterium]